MSTMDRRQVLRLFGGLAAAGVTGAAAGCTLEPPAPGMDQPNGRTVTVGVLAPVGGPFSKVGDDITNGFSLYVTDHAKLLGLYRADVRTAQEGGSVAEAVKAAKNLMDQGVIAIAGVANPAALAAIAPVASSRGIPVISTNAAPAGANGGEFLWRASSVEGEAGQALAPYALRAGTGVYVLRDDSTTAQAETSAFTRAFTGLGGQIAGTSVGTDNFGGRIQAARNTGADAIFAAHTGDAAEALLTAFREANSQLKLLGPGALTESVNLAGLSPLPTQVYTAMFYAPDLDNEDNRRFVASYQNIHGVQPSSAAMAAYDAAGLLDRALRLVQGELTPVKLKDSFKILGQISSPRGTWTFNSDRSPQQAWYLRQLRLDGQVPSNLLDSDLAVLS